jgi:hypothetical protein
VVQNDDTFLCLGGFIRGQLPWRNTSDDCCLDDVSSDPQVEVFDRHAVVGDHRI